MKIYCSKRKQNLDQFVGKDLWVKVAFPLHPKTPTAPIHIGYAKFIPTSSFTFLSNDNDENNCYYIEFISDVYVDATGQYYTTSNTFDIMKDEYMIDKDDIVMVNPPEICSGEEFLNFDDFPEDEE